MPEQIPFIRIFVSSPGDVNDERKIALEVIEQLPYRPGFREKVAFRVIAWDKPGAGAAMRATLTPQEAINRGLPTPAECDIVVVLFWSRMGTPFADTDGQEYQSGTHWELLNALKAKRPETVIYRRTDDPPFKLSDPDFDALHAQYKAVNAFFKSDLFYDADGRIKRGVNPYRTPDDFRRAFEIHLEELVLDILGRGSVAPAREADVTDDENVSTIRAVGWDPARSPFPGLRAFTEDDADIFFGRGYETDALIRQLTGNRFVAVVGASGSGKSSLVGAGMIPRLRANAIPGSKDWKIARFTPGESPFDGLYTALLDAFPQLKPNPLEARRIRQNFIADLREAPTTLIDICAAGLEGAPAWAELLLFIDQFEELFTLARPEDVGAFAAMLDAVAKSERIRVVVTMRADFYHRAVEIVQLAELLRAGSFPLAIPKRDALRQMIERPAERAGLTFDEALVTRILDDTGDEPGNLALMAYALDELYKLDDDNLLTHAEYDQLGGVQGAIGVRAESEFAAMKADASAIQQVFHALVEVDERGTATRRRAQLRPEALDEPVRDLIAAFTDARLLVTNAASVGTTLTSSSAEMASVEVAHEAILRSWPRLSEWIEDTQDDLRLLRQVRNAAQEWDETGRPDFLRWPAERLALVYAMQERLKPELMDTERDFIEPEQYRLYRELGFEVQPLGDGMVDVTPAATIADTSHQRRYTIGARLNDIGDMRRGTGVKNGLPDMLWLPVERSDGKIEFKDKNGKPYCTFNVESFFVAKYLTTYAQFQAFIDSSEYDDPRWWNDFPERRQDPASVTNGNANAPRDSVSWYQSVAFGRWMTARFAGLELPHPSSGALKVGGNALIRLPTEWEWQWMAQNGEEAREFPWGQWDDQPRANTAEAGIQARSTAVGMYPHGAAACGALDAAGNLWEWCLNDLGDPQIFDGFKIDAGKVLRGGSCSDDQHNAASSSRDNRPDHLHALARYVKVGFRVVVGRPMS
ncbi:MAG: SUMF1/EgtB/PvdO family nonheme iron enzyme [Anaerolineae bacterium]|nr:SUMF1/EgtB/PvdO family nonheme iron enzyme [Anaerolineae bacterium]NUQ06115.1 SUMF1/EgtB/PvdO family nonheme iron enzyme [Anaerolineae bacterium]